MSQEYTESRALIAERIKQAREAAGMKQADVAKKLGITPQAVSNYERGKNKIPNNVILQLATIFRTSADYLLGLSNMPIKYSEVVVNMLGEQAVKLPAYCHQSIEELCGNMADFSTAIAKDYPAALQYASDCMEAAMLCFYHLCYISANTDMDIYDSRIFGINAAKEITEMNNAFYKFAIVLQSLMDNQAENESVSADSTD